MKVRKIISKAVVLLMLMSVSYFFISCKKSTRNFVGEYTYKTSGTLSVQLLSGDVDLPLTNTIGQMQILDEKEKGKVLVIKTSLLGNVDRVEATIEGDQIELEDQIIEKELEVGDISGNAKITVSAKGKLYENTIVFDETYSGYFYESATSAAGVIKGNNVMTVANKND